jgi:hypothetical protein
MKSREQTRGLELILSATRLAVFFCSTAFLCACSPAFTDGEYAISGAQDYYFSDAGGDNKFITKRKPGQQGEIVISSRVDAYRVDGNELFIARLPKRVHKGADGALSWAQAGSCEYWSINITGGHKELLDHPVSGLQCS